MRQIPPARILALSLLSHHHPRYAVAMSQRNPKGDDNHNLPPQYVPVRVRTRRLLLSFVARDGADLLLCRLQRYARLRYLTQGGPG